MDYKKIVLLLLFSVFLTLNIYANNIRIVVEITGVNVNSGNVHLEIYTNEQDHRRSIPFTAFILESTNNVLLYELELPEGDCLVWGFQDTNGNGKLDTGIFGIPREPIGLTNYSGRGSPGRFNRHKVVVNRDNTRISINLDVIRF